MINRLSRIFQPTNIVPKGATVKTKDATSKSQRLMLDLGIVRPASPGCFHLLPLGLRALEKLTALIDDEMYKIGGQKVILPTLTPVTLWKKTGRLDNNELFKLTDRHQTDYVLNPTHEESITDLLSSVSPLSYKKFPIRLYQITNKFRDEMKTRFGLMRGREFVMKDLYTFDTDAENAQKTYVEICDSYDRIFRRLGVEFVKVKGAAGSIGGSTSHEYHYLADVGEDKIMSCNKCDYKGNIEVVERVDVCPICKSDVEIRNGIEIGHTFLLGDKYSKPLNATFLSSNGKPDVIQMGCYGLGVSRILAASLEVLSSEKELQWPLPLAPYKVVIVPSKDGSKEDLATKELVKELYGRINSLPNCTGDVLLDDRTNFTIGKRLLEAKQMGYPYTVVIGSKSVQNPPVFEVNEVYEGRQHFFETTDLLRYLKEAIKE